MAGGLQRGKQRTGTQGGTIELPHPETLTTYIASPALLAGVKIRGDVFSWKVRMEGKSRPRLGRGSNGFPSYRHLYTPTSGMVRFDRMEADWPAPDRWKGETGIIEHVIHSAPLVANGPNVERKITFPVMFTDWAAELDLSPGSKQDIAKPTIGYVATGPVVFSGWPGTQPTHTEPSKSDQQQWEGTSWTIDLEGIQSSGQVTIDWWGDVADTDVAEIAKLVEYAAAKGLPTGFKKRGNTIVRNSSDGGTIIMQVGLTTTKEDIERGGSYRVDDPQNLGSAEAITKVNALPALDATFVDRGLTIKTLNDGTTVYTRQGGLLSTKDDEEMPGTFLTLDTSDLTSSGQNTKVYDTTDGEPDDVEPPGTSGLQVVGHRVVKKNRLRSSKLTIYGKDTPQQSIEQENSYQFDDPYGLTSDGAVGRLDASPSTTSGFVNRGVTQKYRTHDHIMYVRRIGVRTTKEDREFPGTYTTTDPQGITTNRKVTTVHDTASPPADPTLTGLKVIAKTPVQLTSAGTPQSETVFEMGKLDSLDRIRLPRQKTLIDSSGLQNVATRTKQWFSNASEPLVPDDVPTNNTVLIDYWDETIYPAIDAEPALYLRVFMYGTRTRQEDIERDRTSVVVDAVDKFHRETTTVVSWTDTLSALETSIRDANRTNLYFDDVRGQLIDSRHAVKSVRESGDDKQFVLSGSSVCLDSLKGKPTGGFAASNPAVYGNTAAIIHINVEGIIVGGPGGFTGGRVMPVYQYRRRAWAKYRRRYTVTEPSSKLFTSLEGKTNNAPFCGRPTHSLMFMPARYSFSFDDVGNRTLVVDYFFECDSELFMNDGDLPDSGSRVSTGGFPLLASSGFYAATLFDAFALLSWPDDADFSVLTA